MFSTSTLTSLVLAFGLTSQFATAHMELLFPPGINSKYNTQTPQNLIDYSNTTPMNADGSNYPCRGYATAALISSNSPVATLTSGSPFTITLAGSATHMGGSCQFSVSYDQGKSFAVLTSIIGGCPLTSTYTIPIPQLPAAAKALFAWTWYNHDGNREEYSNCAVVNVVGTAASFTGPKVFRANTLNDAACQNVGGQDTVFPNPGPSVQYGAGQSSSSPATIMAGCSFDEVSNIVVSPSGSAISSTPVVPVVVAPAPAPVVVVAPVPVIPYTAPVVVSIPTASPVVQASVASPSPSIIYPVTPKILAPADANVPFTSSSTIIIEPVAPTQNVAGPASILCNSKTTWSLCGNGSCTFMGAVAAGTECNNGVIGWPQKMKRNAKRHVRGHKKHII